MRIATLVLVLFLAEHAALGQPEGDLSKVQLFNRDDILTGLSVIDGITGAWIAFSLVSGTHSGTADAFTVIATGPGIIFGAAVIGQGADDGPMWVATLAAGAIFTVAMIHIVTRDSRPSGDTVRTFSKNFILVPTVEEVPNERSKRVGLALAGTF